MPPALQNDSDMYTLLSRELEYTTLKSLVEETAIIYDPNPASSVVAVCAHRALNGRPLACAACHCHCHRPCRYRPSCYCHCCCRCCCHSRFRGCRCHHLPHPAAVVA
jgi:hypothetical protein